jgi:Condensation domain/AMP-binding enzyme C-terminal domain/AMP-binding enzyme/Phosphopantetheine attachment site
VVRGASVMTGYDGDRATNGAAFAGDWFKTGDLGFFDDDGYLFLAGRIRDMINRGGEKVAPQEVDDVLLQHPAVAEAATFAVPHVTLGEDIACAVVLRPCCAATPKDIRQFAAARMAGFKVPRQVVVVDTIPKGPTGKLQRSGLAAKMGLAKDAAPLRVIVAPRTPLEQALAASWQEILRIEQIGIHDDFFVSGGDSLLATRALADIYDLTQVEFDVSRFFDAPTIADVADYLERALDGGLRPPSERGIARAPRQNGMMPASIAQERMWNLQRAAADMPLFNVVHTLRVASCDAAILERSLNDIAQRHETLRTTFTAIDGRLMQVIASRSSVPMRFDDLHRLAAAEKAATVQKFMRERLLHSFDLAHGPLVCAHLMRVAEQENLLLIAMAGIIQDGWSLGLLIDELAELYGAAALGRIARLAPLPIQYADFAQWQRRWRENPGMVAQLAYWREQLRDPLPVLELARPKQATNDFRTGRQKVALPPELAESARRFSRREGVTLFMTLLAAFKIVLYRRTGEDDVRVATHVANRNRPHTTRLIGPLVNTVILRTALNGDLGSREVVRRVRAAALAAYGNQDLPFEEVAAVLNEERGLEPAALAPALMWLQNDTLRPVASTGTALSFEEVDPSMLLPLVTLTGFDVTLMLRETTDGLVGTCVYQSRLFSSKTIDRLLADFQQVLEILVVEPDRPISTFPVATSEGN